MRVSLSKFVMTLLKIRLNDTSMDRVNLFFQQVMHATVAMLRAHDAWEMVDCTARILTDSPNYYFYQPGVSARQSPGGGSPSSGDGSCSDASDLEEDGAPSSSITASLSPHDEVSPFLLRNIEYFHQVGGFSTILERLSSTPKLSLNAMRVILRPLIKARARRAASRPSPDGAPPAPDPPAPLPPPPPSRQVKDVLKRGVLHGFARRVEQATPTKITPLVVAAITQP